PSGGAGPAARGPADGMGVVIACRARPSFPGGCHSRCGIAARAQPRLCCGAPASAPDPERMRVETSRLLGRLQDGRRVRAFRLEDGGGVRADILELGGILARLEVPAARGRVGVVLGLEDAQAYFDDPAYLGALVGRYGNRIGGARFALDGREHELAANEGRNHLHGGRLGFGRRLWEVLEHRRDELVLGLHSPDGEGGYPGSLDVRATYRIEGDRLRLCFEASSDAPTPFNPTHHPYFNLAGDPMVPASAQVLQVPVEGFLPVSDELIPLGDVAPVAG